ncbi:MAG: polysaccharide deacetylase family protein [Bacilli bacterium]|jgi:peptidoglycan/xylan/chitin deacetylase (PgdA/CDA1 family)|nr:polysaccharide deacetylase family protein [Bacilli bacterium]
MKDKQKINDNIIIMIIIITYLIINSTLGTANFTVLHNNIESNFFCFKKSNYIMYKSPHIIKKEDSKKEPKKKPELENKEKKSKVVEVGIPKTKKKAIALTFDDGPNNNYTLQILDILKENEVTATFFVLGNKVNKYANVIKRIHIEGHEIGNHSYNHPSFRKINNNNINKQIEMTNTNIYNIIGESPSLVRPPYGQITKKIASSITYPLILWSIDPKDWNSTPVLKMQNNIIDNLKDGRIIILHDSYKNTVILVKNIIPQIKALGYDIVAVSELFSRNDVKLETGNIYREIKK